MFKGIKNFFKFLGAVAVSNFVVETAKTAGRKSRRFLEHATFAVGTTIGFFAAGLPGAILGAGITHALISRNKPSFKSKSLPAKLFNTGLTAAGAGLGGALGATLGVAAGPVGALIGGAIGAAGGGILTRVSIRNVGRIKNLLTPSLSSRNALGNATENASNFLNLLTAPIRSLGKVMGCSCLFIVGLTTISLITIFASFIIPRQKSKSPSPSTPPATSCFEFDSSFSNGASTQTLLETAIETLIAQYPALINLACQASSTGTITLKYAPNVVDYCGLRSGDTIFFRSYDDCYKLSDKQDFATQNFAHELSHIIQGAKNYKGLFLATIGTELPMSTYPVQPPPWYEDMAESVGMYVYCVIYNRGCSVLGHKHRLFVTQEIGIIN